MTFLERILLFWTDYRFLVATLLFAAWVFITRYVVKHALDLSSRATRRLPSEVDEAIVHTAQLPLGGALLLGGFWILAEISGLAEEPLLWIRKVSQIGLFFFLFLFVARWVDELLHLSASRKEGLKPFVAHFSTWARVGLAIFTLILALDVMGVSMIQVLAALGILSVPVGLALQETLSNLFSGFYLQIERPIRVGQRVKLEGGFEGQVEEIGWRSARLRSGNGETIIVPNNRLTQTIVTSLPVPLAPLAGPAGEKTEATIAYR